MKLTADHLKRIFPQLGRAKANVYAPHLSAAANEAKINTRQRACAFFAQLGHESQDLKFLRELWGNTPAQVRYDVRADLGNTPERDGDGRKYMGRGGLQRTGKANYRRAQEALGLPLIDHPELLEQPQHAFRSDALYWTDHKLNRLADQLTLRGDSRDLKNFDKITKAINGGYNGRVDRQSRYLVAIANLPDDVFSETKSPFDGTISAAAGTKAAIDGTKAASNETPDPKSVLFEKLSKNQSAKTVGASVGKKLVTRLAGPAMLLYSALEAGNVYAWLGVGVFVIGVAGLVFVERKPIANAIKSGAALLQRKLSGG